jgi:hypothetical protein
MNRPVFISLPDVAPVHSGFPVSAKEGIGAHREHDDTDGLAVNEVIIASYLRTTVIASGAT